MAHDVLAEIACLMDWRQEAAMDEIVVECHELTRRYGDFVAVDSLNLTVRRGEIFGLLGPNGAGKTTTILMLLGLTEPTSGSVRVLGLDPTRQPLSIKARVGYLPDQVGFYDGLTARENLIYIAKLNGIRGREMQERIREVAGTGRFERCRRPAGENILARHAATPGCRRSAAQAPAVDCDGRADAGAGPGSGT
jgi:ABC-type lipopolysaccharide export system ATPase subunit